MNLQRMAKSASERQQTPPERVAQIPHGSGNPPTARTIRHLSHPRLRPSPKNETPLPLFFPLVLVPAFAFAFLSAIPAGNLLSPLFLLLPLLFFLSFPAGNLLS